jgi:hypothetical protein
MNGIINLKSAEKYGTAGSDPGLQLERIQLREIELPLKAPFETSFGITSRKRVLIVRILTRAVHRATASALQWSNRSTTTKRSTLRGR